MESDRFESNCQGRPERNLNEIDPYENPYPGDIDDLNFSDNDDPLNELISDGSPEIDPAYLDDDHPIFKLRNNGVYLSAQDVLRVMNEASGKYKYFQRVGQIEGYNSEHALEVAKKQIAAITHILRPLLIEQGIPAEDVRKEIDRIMGVLRELYSGTDENRKAWQTDKKILLEEANDSLRAKSMQRRLGETTLRQQQPARAEEPVKPHPLQQKALDDFSEL